MKSDAQKDSSIELFDRGRPVPPPPSSSIRSGTSSPRASTQSSSTRLTARDARDHQRPQPTSPRLFQPSAGRDRHETFGLQRARFRHDGSGSCLQNHERRGKSRLSDGAGGKPCNAAQDAVAKRAGVTLSEVKGSHGVYISQAETVAKVIESAAKGVKTTE